MWAQRTDTLSISSEAFGTERTIHVHLHEFHDYLADDTKLPVFFVLDGQHEWFVEPTLTTIEYLQYTHEIPMAIVVVIPINDRFKEMGIKGYSEELLPLHRFITEEIPAALEAYPIGDFRLLIGHSFAASFSLYSYLNAPDFYSAIFAHTPADKLSLTMEQFVEREIDPSKVYLSIGGMNSAKDSYHRARYEKAKPAFPELFEAFTIYEADFSTHNAVPIVSNPLFFTWLFDGFSTRFSQILKVDDSYKLAEAPGTVEETLKQINDILEAHNSIPMEIPEINGIASKLWNSGYADHTQAVYEQAAKWYPNYTDFQYYLADLHLEKDPAKAKAYAEESKRLLMTYDRHLEWYEDSLKDIEDLLKKLED